MSISQGCNLDYKAREAGLDLALSIIVSNALIADCKFRKCYGMLCWAIKHVFAQIDKFDHLTWRSTRQERHQGCVALGSV